MSSSGDPRVFLASERTLLAWMRTGIAIIGLGFVVARFGLFLEATSGLQSHVSHVRSMVIGVSLVLLGGAAVTNAALQHQRLCRGLRPSEIPAGYTFHFGIWFAYVLAAVSVVLALHLVLRKPDVDRSDRTHPPAALQSGIRCEIRLFLADTCQYRQKGRGADRTPHGPVSPC
jgi:putative membrane protein